MVIPVPSMVQGRRILVMKMVFLFSRALSAVSHAVCDF